MASVIRMAICPRCGHGVRTDALRPAKVDWFDSDDAGDGLWRSGRPDASSELRVCPSCHESLLQMYYEHLHWMREIRFYQEGG
jgi:ribosomal protein S27AE